MNVTKFEQSNDNTVQKAIQSVNQKFNPEADGFTFKRVLSVDDQIVAGVNYLIVLEYTNGEGESRYYDTIIYSVPW